MASRSLFTLLTALFLGATLSAPLAVTAEAGHGSDSSLEAMVTDGAAVPTTASEADSPDSDDSAASGSVFSRYSASVYPLTDLPATKRLAVCPQARAPPHSL